MLSNAQNELITRTGKVARWRRADLREEVARRWQVEVHQNMIRDWLSSGRYMNTAAAPAPR